MNCVRLFELKILTTRTQSNMSARERERERDSTYQFTKSKFEVCRVGLGSSSWQVGCMSPSMLKVDWPGLTIHLSLKLLYMSNLFKFLYLLVFHPKMGTAPFAQKM